MAGRIGWRNVIANTRNRRDATQQARHPMLAALDPRLTFAAFCCLTLVEGIDAPTAA
jgi:hypothetical protein